MKLYRFDPDVINEIFYFNDPAAGSPRMSWIDQIIKLLRDNRRWNFENGM